MKTKKDLQKYIREDRLVNNINSKYQYRLRLFFRSENACAVHYLNALRHQEYYIDNVNRSLLHRFFYYFWKFRTARLGYKYNIGIMVNTVGYGLKLPHLKGGIILNACSIGNYCIANSGVVVGNKGNQNETAVIGNNVQLSIGCKVIGRVLINDNVIVAPNAVVINDVPENSIVGGVPAKIIKYRR